MPNATDRVTVGRAIYSDCVGATIAPNDREVRTPQIYGRASHDRLYTTNVRTNKTRHIALLMRARVRDDRAIASHDFGRHLMDGQRENVAIPKRHAMFGQIVWIITAAHFVYTIGIPDCVCCSVCTINGWEEGGGGRGFLRLLITIIYQAST